MVRLRMAWLLFLFVVYGIVRVKTMGWDWGDRKEQR